MANDEPVDKDIDILFAGTVVNPVSVREKWKNHENKAMARLIDETIKLGRSLPGTPVHLMLEMALETNNIDLEWSQKVNLFITLIPLIEKYLRFTWRIKVLRSLKDFKLTIVGNGPWKELVPGNNVTYIPACSFNEVNRLMMRSKIVLNVIPMFPAGAHERIFSGMLGHGIVATDKNPYLATQFVDMEEILYYDILNLQQFHENLSRVLNDKRLYMDIVEAGREKTIKNHTWLNRAQEILKLFS